MDLSGSIQGAGGVGGLLAVNEHSGGTITSYYPTYDGNGNVSEYLDSNGDKVAHYEYDAFGNEITAASTGTKKAASVGNLNSSFDLSSKMDMMMMVTMALW